MIPERWFVPAAGYELDVAAVWQITTKGKLIEVFKSFSPLIRLRLKVRLPNPDLTRYTRKIYDELNAGEIREYTQDMRNPRGLNRDEGNLPHASVALAEAGYRDGDVTLVGIRDGRIRKEVIGHAAARGKTTISKESVRQLVAVNTVDLQVSVLTEIQREIIRLCPAELTDATE